MGICQKKENFRRKAITLSMGKEVSWLSQLYIKKE
jgi:hypothetical protein